MNERRKGAGRKGEKEEEVNGGKKNEVVKKEGRKCEEGKKFFGGNGCSGWEGKVVRGER